MTPKMTNTERIAKLEERFHEADKDIVLSKQERQRMKDKLNSLEKWIWGINDKLDEHFEKVENKFAEMDSKFANKWVEKAFWGVISAIGMAVLWAILKLIIS